MEPAPVQICLRPLTQGDASERYLSWLNDSEVTKHLETKSSTMEELVRYVADNLQKTDCRLLGIFDKKGDQLIGTVKFYPINWEDGFAQFAMMIGDKLYWGKGLGTISTRLAVEYAFDELNLKQINLGVIAANEPAIKAYHRVGFKDVAHGRLVVRADGSTHSATDMVLKRDEFKRDNI